VLQLCLGAVHVMPQACESSQAFHVSSANAGYIEPTFSLQGRGMNTCSCGADRSQLSHHATMVNGIRRASAHVSNVSGDEQVLDLIGFNVGAPKTYLLHSVLTQRSSRHSGGLSSVNRLRWTTPQAATRRLRQLVVNAIALLADSVFQVCATRH
jgi:hypothetical protein